MSFKRTTAQEREEAINQRLRKGVSYVKSDLPIFTPVDGDNRIRIVPPLASDPYASIWGLEIWVYFLNNRLVLSNRTFNLDAYDPISSYFFELREHDPEGAKKYKGSKKHLMFILDLNDDKETLKIWPAPITFIQDCTRLSKNRRTGEFIPIEDPDEGRCIFFTKTGKGFNTSYVGVEIDQDTYPIQDELANDLYEFKDILAVPTEEELQAILKRSQEETAALHDHLEHHNLTPQDHINPQPNLEPLPDQTQDYMQDAPVSSKQFAPRQTSQIRRQVERPSSRQIERPSNRQSDNDPGTFASNNEMSVRERVRARMRPQN